MKRPAPWQARRIATAKALRALPKCEYTEGCEGRAMGYLPDNGPPEKWKRACVACAQRVHVERQKVRNQPAPRSGT